MFRLDAAHDIAVAHGHANLSIQTQVGFFLPQS